VLACSREIVLGPVQVVPTAGKFRWMLHARTSHEATNDGKHGPRSISLTFNIGSYIMGFHKPGVRRKAPTRKCYRPDLVHGKYSGTHPSSKARGISWFEVLRKSTVLVRLPSNSVVTAFHVPSGLGYLAHLNLCEGIKSTYSVA